jgi:hypothetical protein
MWVSIEPPSATFAITPNQKLIIGCKNCQKPGPFFVKARTIFAKVKVEK